MLAKWAVALISLLIPAVTGCRSALPERPLKTDVWPANAHDTPLANPTPSTGTGYVVPAKFEETEPLPVPADDDEHDKTLSLADLEGLAFRNNPTLAAATARIEMARGRQQQAGLYPNPVIGYHATEIGNRGSAGQQGGFVTQRIITGGKLDLDQAISGKEVDEAHFRLHAQQQRVLSDVRVRFYRARVAQRRVELTTELCQISGALVKATETLIEGRLGTENDLLQAEIRSDESHILVENARNEHLEAWRRLMAVVGVPAMPVTPLSGELENDLPSFDWDRCYANVLGSNPALEAARTRVERASMVIRRAKKEPIPNIDFSIRVRHHNVTSSDVANLQIGIPIPIFDKNQGGIRSAEADWVTACNEVKRIELELQDRLAEAYRRYANARQQVDRYGQSMIPKAQQSLRLVKEGYEKGQVEYLTLLAAQQTYVQVTLSHLDSLQELRTSSAIIDGQLLSGGLSAIRAIR